MRSQCRETGLKQSLTEIPASGRLELLQRRAPDAAGEDVARQQQHRQPIDGGQRRAGDHVRRAGPMEMVHTSVCSRLSTSRSAEAVCTVACSLRGRTVRELVESLEERFARGRRRCRDRRSRARRRKTAAPRRRALVCCCVRKRTTAWATVSRRLVLMSMKLKAREGRGDQPRLHTRHW